MNDRVVDNDRRDDHHPRLGRSRLWRSGIVIGGLVGLGLLLAACGTGSASPGVANLGSTTTTTSAPASRGDSGPSPGGGGGSANSSGGFGIGGVSAAYSQCMRTHGVPNFPDPNGQGVVQATGIDPNSPQFQSAQRACAKFSPGGGKPPSPAQQQKMLANALKFSECMRAHGLADFPDPTTSGGGIGIKIKISGGTSNDLNPGNPIFQAAQKSCQGIMTGGKRVLSGQLGAVAG